MTLGHSFFGLPLHTVKKLVIGLGGLELVGQVLRGLLVDRLGFTPLFLTAGPLLLLLAAPAFAQWKPVEGTLLSPWARRLKPDAVLVEHPQHVLGVLGVARAPVVTER